MITDQYISAFAATISFIGLIYVGKQVRDATRQRESESVVKLYENNRELISLGFLHPILFRVMEGESIPDALAEKRYLQLWLNQLYLMHWFLGRAIVKNEVKEELGRNLADFFSLDNMQKHWADHGMFYPDSFQKRVNNLMAKLSKGEPPKLTAHPSDGQPHHDART